MACYSIGDLSRRDLMKMSAAIAGANAFFPIHDVVAAALQPTPRQVLGPFYPLTSLARTSDLTHVPGRTGRAAGLVRNARSGCAPGTHAAKLADVAREHRILIHPSAGWKSSRRLWPPLSGP